MSPKQRLIKKFLLGQKALYFTIHAVKALGPCFLRMANTRTGPSAIELHLWQSFFPLASIGQILQRETCTSDNSVQKPLLSKQLWVFASRVLMIEAVPAKSQLLTAMPMMLKRTNRIWKNSSLPRAIVDSELFAVKWGRLEAEISSWELIGIIALVIRKDTTKEDRRISVSE